MSSISDALDRFVAVFNDGDLDGVMAFFTDDAEYRPGDGSAHQGKAAIRAAFAPQFAGALGRMRFDMEDRLVDEAAGKAALRWICRHDLTGALGRSVPRWLRLFVRLRHGTRIGWRGVDVFHFDGAGRIRGKFTYANYDRPQLRADLGAAL
jgi:ketosteroid isomerase-like protein